MFTSPPAFNLSQHQGLFQGVSSSHQVPKYRSFSFSISPSNEYSGLISSRIDWLDLLAVQETLESSPTPQYYSLLRGFSHGSDGKESACNAGDPGSGPGSGRCPGEGNGSPLQNSCLENLMDRGAWRATVHEVTKSQTPLSD